MARSAFETTVRLQLDRFSPEEAQKRHVAIARSVLANYVSKQASKPDVRIEVDGHAASNEDQVKPFGVIVYRFLNIREITLFALEQARTLSPVGSKDDARAGHPGLYKASWFAIVDNHEAEVDTISGGATVMITNDQPYSRKINTGARGFERYAPPGVVEKVRQLVLAKYRSVVDAQIVFLNLEGGYTLKRDLRKVTNGRRYGGPRNDARAGSQITYPALVLTPKKFGA